MNETETERFNIFGNVQNEVNEGENYTYQEGVSQRRCMHEGCLKCSQGGTKYCIKHGGKIFVFSY